MEWFQDLSFFSLLPGPPLISEWTKERTFVSKASENAVQTELGGERERKETEIHFGGMKERKRRKIKT